jgi:hypothetical protein
MLLDVAAPSFSGHFWCQYAINHAESLFQVPKKLERWLSLFGLVCRSQLSEEFI